MVIKNKEERTESIWRFAAVATIPLLLLFIAGFSLGDTAGKEQRVNKKMLEEVEAKLAETEQKLVLQDSFFRRGDEILSQVETRVLELDKSLRAAAQMNDVSLITDWDDEMNKYFRVVLRDLDNMEIDFTTDKKTLDKAQQIGYKYLREYVRLQKNSLTDFKEYVKSQMDAGKLGELEQKEADLKKKEEDLAASAKATATETNLEKLQAKLERCEAKLEKYALNKPAADAVKAKINDVNTNMLPKIEDRNFRNDTRALNELRTKIFNTLTSALTDLSTIQ